LSRAIAPAAPVALAAPMAPVFLAWFQSVPTFGANMSVVKFWKHIVVMLGGLGLLLAAIYFHGLRGLLARILAVFVLLGIIAIERHFWPNHRSKYREGL
jgi:hypothetical protein